MQSSLTIGTAPGRRCTVFLRMQLCASIRSHPFPIRPSYNPSPRVTRTSLKYLYSHMPIRTPRPTTTSSLTLYMPINLPGTHFRCSATVFHSTRATCTPSLTGCSKLRRWHRRPYEGSSCTASRAGLTRRRATCRSRIYLTRKARADSEPGTGLQRDLWLGRIFPSWPWPDCVGVNGSWQSGSSRAEEMLR